MTYEARIVVLANSWKQGGTCVAGRKVIDEQHTEWIRPISARSTHELRVEEMRCDGGDLTVLDIVDVPLLSPSPRLHQVENHFVDPSRRWHRWGRATWHDLQGHEQAPPSLWSNGESTYNGFNDKVSAVQLVSFDASLYLIKPSTLTVVVQLEGYAVQKLKARAEFEYLGATYKLKITDPIAHAHFVQKGAGRYRVNTVLLCISLTEIADFSGGPCAFKLVAGFFTPSRNGNHL